VPSEPAFDQDPEQTQMNTPSYREEVLICGGERNLIGIHCIPKVQTSDVAVVFLNAGLIHRAGPGRLYVQLARALAGKGIASLRIDFSSLGDSPPRRAAIPLLQLAALEPSEAVEAMLRKGAKQVYLAGICSGAFAALRSVCADARIAGAILINPQELAQIGGDESQNWARRYFTKSLFSAKAWRNLFTGRIKYKRLVSTIFRQAVALTQPRAPSEDGPAPITALRSDVSAVIARGGRLFFLVSQSDISVEHVDHIRRGLDVEVSDRIDYAEIAGSEHLFTRPQDKQAVQRAVLDWIESCSKAHDQAPASNSI